MKFARISQSVFYTSGFEASHIFWANPAPTFVFSPDTRIFTLEGEKTNMTFTAKDLKIFCNGELVHKLVADGDLITERNPIIFEWREHSKQ